ncbi:hypothetical protein Lalb_Chr09g0324971 [Lupinus albus]|uniref:Uncharacterized protein n=1 Tax=Lupinus albus TaxID=3870 RepID=A0A6A4PZS2_LUPAL|nr:hypothetical protein Lalb_Chr09g0324971 [Lupinus albus]
MPPPTERDMDLKPSYHYTSTIGLVDSNHVTIFKLLFSFVLF